MTSECKLKQQIDKYYNYITVFSPLIIRRERPVSKETALTNVKKIYFIFGFLAKYLKKKVKELNLSLLLIEENLRSFFEQVSFVRLY